MMLYKPIVSLIVAFAAASSATASATPLRRRGNGGYPPPPATPIPRNECATSHAQCCETYTSSNNPNILKYLEGLNLNLPVGVAQSCTPLGGNCNTNAVCCNKINQNGFINVGCSPIEL